MLNRVIDEQCRLRPYSTNRCIGGMQHLQEALHAYVARLHRALPARIRSGLYLHPYRPAAVPLPWPMHMHRAASAERSSKPCLSRTRPRASASATTCAATTRRSATAASWAWRPSGCPRCWPPGCPLRRPAPLHVRVRALHMPPLCSSSTSFSAPGQHACPCSPMQALSMLHVPPCKCCCQQHA